MSREVIQDFLTWQDFVGICPHKLPYMPIFHGLDSVLGRTKQALGQGVLQVVENVPDSDRLSWL
ncbi:MAG: hypothetical protein ACK5EU_03550 [Pseudanabaena sp.]|uniref:hypothetical protein n=1 Tax=Pseudanabaena mucicola TaxID=71190 RepID=UPI00257700F3|nr:hypothetical protein [Pseudanabaena mucicola]MCA6572422.1 hypothetical protein [Pseudanabaena sp. M53BS1SP1A06MG]MCA6583030.1 hypothetical protein [Pseudanabaena sp. M34BS1SP1A06MG]MCA6587218.1 hypothetical protein [Pseudanabaena sp. M051S1SP1A06QC]MCA6591711.1 hypothetical protein [Pseudanabaena sp. M38BS1SP1A06MG]MCA6595153.1 hypothetical protein [Pseudanabaena sp. M046S1SP1A06QC]MCA6601026.1 hypothetical protein [Pseudanabaena sp. M57BS1SP1A06MG]MCA6621256.1 hypothetical protein [Pseud